MLSDTLTPILEAYKVGIISGIEVKSITLGTIAPKLNGMMLVINYVDRE